MMGMPLIFQFLFMILNNTFYAVRFVFILEIALKSFAEAFKTLTL